MKNLPSFELLIDSFSKLPGIGAKSAERMAYAVLAMKEEDALSFAESIKNSRNLIHKCPNCGLFTENELCEICKDETRDHKICIVVAEPKDALSFERLNQFKGIYHVLGGTLSPSKGIGPESLSIAPLLDRVAKEGIEEIVIATNPTIEGETTALFLAKVLSQKGVTVTRLAYGLPMGASVDYADSLTLGKALEGRKKL